MKITEIPKCAQCGFSVLHRPTILFYEVQIVPCHVDTHALREQYGLTLIYGSSELAEFVGATPEVANPEERLRTTIYLCQECWMSPELPHLATMQEMANREKK